MKKGWLIYNRGDLDKNCHFAHRFLDQGRKIGFDIELIIREDVMFGVDEKGLFIKKGNCNVPLPRFAINRSRDSLIGRQLELMGCRVFNSSYITDICNDKAKTHQEVNSLGIASVYTLFCKGSYSVCDKAQLVFPAVVKTVDGHGGNGVFKAESLDQLKDIIFKMPHKDLLIQRMCGRPGFDIRVFIIGKRIIAAVARHSETDFRANYSLGGKARLYHLNAEEKCIVNRIVEHFQFDYVGIDFLIDEKGGLLFNEIEDAVGSRTLSSLSSIDIVEEYLIHILSELR